MISHGALTAKIGDFLDTTLKPRGYDVFYDHGQPGDNVGSIVSWFGEGDVPERETELTQLDIAVVEHRTGHVILLAEIEETNDSPKGLIADAVATLIASHIAFGKAHQPLHVGDWTTLLVLGKGPEEHRSRNRHLTDRVRAAKSALGPAKAGIGRVVIGSFETKADLEAKLLEMIPTP